MDDDMLVEHGKDTTQMWVKYEDCVQEIALTKADAQATIAALQAQLATCFKLSGADPDGNEDWRLAPHAVEEVTRLRNDCDELGDEIGALREQLTQRTAELAQILAAVDEGLALTDIRLAIKTVEETQAELERVRGELVEATHNVNVYQSLYSTSCMDRALLENDLRDLRTLIAALPKVEGAVVVSNGYVKDSTRCHALFGADEDAALYAALLQHRQGME